MQQLLNSNLNIHLIATGAGSTIQSKLWSTAGCSDYLSGASFPYATEETEEILGFTPDSFCSEDTAIDLASAAYMKAFRFKSGKNTVGVGVTASVASTREHRGDHRVHVCIISDDKVVTNTFILPKGVGNQQRGIDDVIVEDFVIYNLMTTLMPDIAFHTTNQFSNVPQDASAKAVERFMLRPFFNVDGSRKDANHISNLGPIGMISGAFNPPHQGHFGMADAFQKSKKKPVVFEVSVTAPHKTALTVQEMLQRAKMLKGKRRVFTADVPLYYDKNKAFNKVSFIIGADALQRILDPVWLPSNFSTVPLFIDDFSRTKINNKNNFFVFSRIVNGKLLTCYNLINDFRMSHHERTYGASMFQPMRGKWDVSSTALRK